MNAITSTSKNSFPRPEFTYMLNACWGFQKSVLRKPAYHLSLALVCPHLCSSLAYGTSTQSKPRRCSRLCTGWVLRFPGWGDPANATKCLGSSKASPDPHLPRGLPTLPSNWPAEPPGDFSIIAKSYNYRCSHFPPLLRVP